MTDSEHYTDGIDWLLEELYYSAYVNHHELNDVEAGYEYAVQQLCSDIIARTHLTKDDEMEAMNRAQERYFDTDTGRGAEQ